MKTSLCVNEPAPMIELTLTELAYVYGGKLNDNKDCAADEDNRGSGSDPELGPYKAW